MGSPVFDLHCDAVLKLVHRGAHFDADNQISHVDIPKMRRGGVDGVFFSLWSDPVFQGEDAVKRTQFMLDNCLSEISRCSDSLFFSTSSSDLDNGPENGKINACLGIEGGSSINNNLDHLRRFYEQGVRRLTLTHTRSLDWAGAATDEGSEKGLSAFGRDVVALMNELGMVVDVAHTSERTTLDAVKCSKKPVFCTHSAARALFEMDRLATDEMISAIGESGGVFGIALFPEFGCQDVESHKQWVEEIIRKLNESVDEEGTPEEKAQKNMDILLDVDPPGDVGSIEGMLPHFDHVIDLIGEDYVGLGTDFDGMPYCPMGLENASKFDNLRMAMSRHGYSDERIRKVMGGNVRRVLREVLKA